jgi:hypothetical protein
MCNSFSQEKMGKEKYFIRIYNNERIIKKLVYSNAPWYTSKLLIFSCISR